MALAPVAKATSSLMLKRNVCAWSEDTATRGGEHVFANCGTLIRPACHDADATHSDGHSDGIFACLGYWAQMADNVQQSALWGLAHAA